MNLKDTYIKPHPVYESRARLSQKSLASWFKWHKKTTFLFMFNFPEILHISPNRRSVHSVDTECYRVEVIINELPSNMLTSVSYTNVTLSREIAPSTFIISRTHDTVAQWLLRYEVMSTRPSCNEVLSVVNVFKTLMSPAWSSQFVIKRFSGPRWGFFPHNLRTTLERSVKNSNGQTVMGQLTL